MTHTQQRERLRAVLAGSQCLSPASVYDGFSAHIAESVGYQLGMLAGSVSANTTLAAPDLILITLTEFADQIRRIMRYSDLSLIVDADHGYGNALNVMRTIEEVEHAGASAASIEDTVLPLRFGATGGDEVLSLEESVGKMKAAVAARRDPSFVVLGRTSALKAEGLEGACRRAKAYAAAGVDAIFVVGLETVEQAAAIHEAAGIPLVIGTAPASITADLLAPAGARVLLLGHQPLAAAAKALHETYTHLYTGGAPGDLKGKIASGPEMDAYTNGAAYREWQQAFLR